MNLLPLDRTDLIELVAGWLTAKENHQWLDFGNGRQTITPALLKIMAQRDTHFLRAYTDDAGVAIGVVSLNSVDLRAHTGTLWGVTGDKSFRCRGYATLAASKFLTLAFRELGLHAVNTWVVDGNPSRRLIERINFRFIGRQRQCHYIDGECRDRLLYDLLASEHEELDDARWRRARPIDDPLASTELRA